MLLLLTLQAVAVIGGSPDTAHPEVAYLSRSDDEGVLTCGGVLISKKHILIPGDCSDLAGGEARFGDNAWQPDQTVEIESVTLHPQYGDQVALNMAVATLAEPVSIPPARMDLTPIDEDEYGRELLIVGYGPTSFPGGHDEGVRRSGLTEVSYADDVIFGTKGGAIGVRADPAIYVQTPSGDLLIGLTSHFTMSEDNEVTGNVHQQLAASRAFIQSFDEGLRGQLEPGTRPEIVPDDDDARRDAPDGAQGCSVAGITMGPTGGLLAIVGAMGLWRRRRQSQPAAWA